MTLANESCTPCRTGDGKLSAVDAAQLLATLEGWVMEGKRIKKLHKFKNFALALAFVNQVASVAEAQGHHPDITFGWGYVETTLITHNANGLTRNDFIMAAPIDDIGQTA